MIELSKNSNLLEQDPYKYSLQEVDEPNLFRDLYPYTEVPKTPFNFRKVPINVPENIWITDTTFRDGQQSQTPYSPKQILDLFDISALFEPGQKLCDCPECGAEIILGFSKDITLSSPISLFELSQKMSTKLLSLYRHG